ncbi:hypothetical protein [Flavobacterium sp. HTF]|uniref:hypothetical protein n=1 Tax=Flavobacterium sp. HTF TaxID=2170732 RepID=UPI000D5E1775|nr:hypothetical protein [Flavobacterium sp. HTF]PWB20681.1 hypothetical protein DCO46_20370 [Flavobacterium sp. HTF]
MKSICTIPKLVRYDDLSKPWFIFFRFSGKLFRYKYTRLDALGELYEHTSKMMTLRYAKVVKEVDRNQIMEKSPDS